MPIDSSRAAQQALAPSASIAQLAQAAEVRARLLGVVGVGRQDHQPLDAQRLEAAQRLEGREQAAPRRGRTWSPRRPGPPGPAPAATRAGLGRRLLEPPAQRARRRASGRRRRAAAALRALLRLQVADQVPAQARPRAGRPGRAILASASWTLFSPKSRRPAAKASRTASAGWVLLTATRVTSSGARAGARRRPGDALPDGGDALGDHLLLGLERREQPLRRWPRSGAFVGFIERYFSRCAIALGDLVLADRDRAQVVVGLGVAGVDRRRPS